MKPDFYPKLFSIITGNPRSSLYPLHIHSKLQQIESMVPPKEPLIAHLSPIIHWFPSSQNIFNLLPLLILLPLICCKVLQPFALLSDPSPEVLIFFDDSIVQLTGFAHSTALVELQLLSEGVSMSEGFSFSDFRRFIGRGFINYWLRVSLPILLEIDKAAIIPLIEQQLLVHLAHLLSVCCLRIFRVPLLLLFPSDELLKIQAHPRSIMRLIVIVKLLLIAIDNFTMIVVTSCQHLSHIHRLGLPKQGKSIRPGGIIGLRLIAILLLMEKMEVVIDLILEQLIRANERFSHP